MTPLQHARSWWPRARFRRFTEHGNDPDYAIRGFEFRIYVGPPVSGRCPFCDSWGIGRAGRYWYWLRNRGYLELGAVRCASCGRRRGRRLVVEYVHQWEGDEC